MDLLSHPPDAATLARVAALCEDGRAAYRRFDREVRSRSWHPFMPADYDRVLEALLPLRRPGLRFLELGSATGVISIMADMLGFEAYGIELSADLVAVARELGRRHGSAAHFAVGSFLPAGYVWRSGTGDDRPGTIGSGEPAYARLGREMHDFDVVFGYPWHGEAPLLRDVVHRHGAPGATLLLYDQVPGVETVPASASRRRPER